MEKIPPMFDPFPHLCIWHVVDYRFFANPPRHSDEVIHVFGLVFPEASFMAGLALALRVLNFAALSLMFIFTTKTLHLILSLIQQCKLPPKIAYGVLAGYRMLPTMKEEFATILVAYRIRGSGQEKGIKGKWKLYKRFLIPLLASAIRKAERTSMAMESRGFTGERNRTFYRQFFVSKADGVFLSFMVAALIGIVLISLRME